MVGYPPDKEKYALCVQRAERDSRNVTLVPHSRAAQNDALGSGSFYHPAPRSPRHLRSVGVSHWVFKAVVALLALVLAGCAPGVSAQVATPSATAIPTAMPTVNPNAPTVSAVAVTSSPGADGEYTSLDVIEATVTFSEAVTVTGTPQLTLAIGDLGRRADYAGDGTSSAQVVFRYEVQPDDQDDDGLRIPANALALDGGAIAATDDSTDATLAHEAVTTTQRVDTEIVILSNMGQADGTPLRINAGESYRFTVRFGSSSVIHKPDQIVFDVKTASETLVLDVVAEFNIGSRSRFLRAEFIGSVATTGRQVFRSEDFTFYRVITEGFLIPFTAAVEEGALTITLRATGTGYIEVGSTESTNEDPGAATGWSIGDGLAVLRNGLYVESDAHLPQLSVVGHATQVVRVLTSYIASEPYDGTTYRAGERIEAVVYLNSPLRAVADPVTVPLTIGGERRLAELNPVEAFYNVNILSLGSLQHYLTFTYTVQAGDTGDLVLGADPLGGGGVVSALGPRVPLSLSAPAYGASHDVDGAETWECDAVHCAYLTSDPNLWSEAVPEDTLWAYYYGPDAPGVPQARISNRFFTYAAEEYRILQAFVPYQLGDSPRVEFVFSPALSDVAVARLGFASKNHVLDFAETTYSEKYIPIDYTEGAIPFCLLRVRQPKPGVVGHRA